MGGKIVVWCILVHYFMIAGGYVVVVDVPEQNNSSEEQNNQVEVDTLIEQDGSEVVIENWYNWYNLPKPSEADSICGSPNKGYSLFESTQSCYKFHHEFATWDDAEATCVREGGHLAVINSQDEADFFMRQFRRTWILFHLGFYLEEGSWVTVDGQTLSEAGYENWMEGEPSNAFGTQNCGAMRYDGSFTDIPCYYMASFICEKETNSQQPNEDEETKRGTMGNVNTSVQEETLKTDKSEPVTSVEGYTECDAIYEDYKLGSVTRSCYKFHKETASRDDAEAICRREHATLVKIDSLREARIVTKLPATDAAYVGQLRGSWQLVYGREPEDGAIEQEDRFWEHNDSEDLPCMASYFDGIFSVVPCNFELAFICEKTDFNGHHYLEPVASLTEAPFKTTDMDLSEEQYSPEHKATSVGFHNECPTDTEYTFLESTRSCYKFHADRATWNDAETTCVREGGHLAVINSQDEAAYFIENFPVDSVRVFLGFHLKKGSWVTIQGQTLHKTGYVNWNFGEPNNADGDQNCGSMYRDGTFDDIGCDTKHTFICEINAIPKLDTELEVPHQLSSYPDDTLEEEKYSMEADTPRPEIELNNDCDTTATGYLFYVSTHSCYKVHTDRATWNDAEETCVREGGHLAVINSQDEADILTTLYPEDTEHVFVGFSYFDPLEWNTTDMYSVRRDGEWLTIDGKTLSEAGYENWSPGEPNNAGGREYCGTMYSNGKLDDSTCYNLWKFICEIKPIF